MTSLAAPLSRDQVLMLRAVYTGYETKRQWPTWRYVKRRFRQDSDSDPATVRSSFPVIGERSNPGPHYSALRYDSRNLTDDNEMRLSIAAGLHLTEYKRIAGTLVKVIQFFADTMKNGVGPNDDDVTVTSDRLASAMGWDPNLVLPLPDFLHHEPFALITGSKPNDGNWEVTLGEDGLIPYCDAATIEAYVEKTVELVEAAITTTLGAHGRVAPSTSSPVRKPYINEDLIEELEGLEGTGWHLGKLTAMLRELNANYEAGHTYACLSLCRGIIDHVPPIFGHGKFSDVVNQVSFGRTDKKHLKRLNDDRNISDDALHRHISKHADLIEIQDVPQRQGLNTLVRLIIDTIKSSLRSSF